MLIILGGGEFFLKGSEWTPIYLMIVLIIAAILLVEVIKPVMKQAASSASSNLAQSNNLIGGFSIIIFEDKIKKLFSKNKIFKGVFKPQPALTLTQKLF